MMRWLMTLIRTVLAPRRDKATGRRLMTMYLNESNAGGMRKPNRERN
jgi:hypothetical protein